VGRQDLYCHPRRHRQSAGPGEPKCMFVLLTMWVLTCVALSRVASASVSFSSMVAQAESAITVADVMSKLSFTFFISILLCNQAA